MARTVWIALTVVVALALLLLVAQLVLPGIAAQRLRDRLSRDGQVQSVDVSAFPAVKLLWGSADAVTIHLGQLRASAQHTGDLLARAAQTTNLDVSVATLSEGPLTLHDVQLRKRGTRLDAQAGLSETDLHAALPPGFDVQPLASGGGQLLLRGSISLFGLSAAADAILLARDGRVVIEPAGVPFGNLVSLTLFADPRVFVEGVGARASAAGFTLTAAARLTNA